MASARAELAELEKLAPADVEPLRYFKGRIAFEEGDYQTAFDELSASGVRDKPGSWLRLVLKLSQLTARASSMQLLPTT